MNKELRSKLTKMREHLYCANSVYIDMLVSDDYSTMSIEDMKKLGLALRHLDRCRDRLFELYYREDL